MPRFVVRVGYKWVTPCYRDVEIDALDEDDAGAKALLLAESDTTFWTESVECDGEAGAAQVFETRRAI